MAQKTCSCGKKVDELYSYFDKVSKYRITCCEQCAEDNKLNDESKYEKTLYKNIKSDQITINEDGSIKVKTIINHELNKTPKPDASRS